MNLIKITHEELSSKPPWLIDEVWVLKLMHDKGVPVNVNPIDFHLKLCKDYIYQEADCECGKLITWRKI